MNPNSPNSPDKPLSSSSGVLPPEAEQRLKTDAGAVVETAKDAVKEIRAAAEAEVGDLAAEGKHQLDKAVDKAKGIATEQKELLSEQLSGVASAVSKVASELEAEQSATAGYARTLSDTVERFTTTIKDRDIDELLHMAEDFGRKQPAAFMAVAALAGFAASRFLVASAKRRSVPATYGDLNYGSGAYGGTGVGDGGVSMNYTGTARGSESGLAAQAGSTQAGGGQSGGSQSPRRTGSYDYGKGGSV